MTTKSRSVSNSGGDLEIENKVYSGQTLISHTKKRVNLVGFQETVSTGHRWPPKGLAALLEDRGGGFRTSRVEWGSSPCFIDVESNPLDFTRWSQRGPLYVRTYNSTKTRTNLGAPYSLGAMNGFGATGIARALPTNPLSGMGQFLGELRQLPQVPFKDWKKKARKFKSLARNGSNEYLNIQFGWLPFVKDLRDFAKVTRNSAKIIDTYARNSGKHIRRRSTVSKDRVTDVGTPLTWVGAPAVPTNLVISNGTQTRTTVTETSITFSGAFTYYLPEGNSTSAKMRRFEALANHLYGVRLTPDLLWKLAPWSWAADWVGNIGSVIHNWSAFANDGLVMHYGYVMVRKTVTESWVGVNLKLLTGPPANATDILVTETKQRVRATPYGFGLNPSSFTGKQWSIIAALGISRAPRSLDF